MPIFQIMGRSHNGVYDLKRRTTVTHYKIKNRNKTSKEGIAHYKKTTGCTKPVCSQNLRKRKVKSGPLKGKEVSSSCSQDIVAAHVSIQGMEGIYVIPMCNTHNDSLNPNAAPAAGSTVIIKQKCIAMKVPSDRKQTKKHRPFARNKTKSNNNKNTKNLSKKATLLRARRLGYATFVWDGKRLNVADYKIARDTRRVKKK